MSAPTDDSKTPVGIAAFGSSRDQMIFNNAENEAYGWFIYEVNGSVTETVAREWQSQGAWGQAFATYAVPVIFAIMLMPWLYSFVKQKWLRWRSGDSERYDLGQSFTEAWINYAKHRLWHAAQGADRKANQWAEPAFSWIARDTKYFATAAPLFLFTDIALAMVGVTPIGVAIGIGLAFLAATAIVFGWGHKRYIERIKSEVRSAQVEQQQAYEHFVAELVNEKTAGVPTALALLKARYDEFEAKRLYDLFKEGKLADVKDQLKCQCAFLPAFLEQLEDGTAQKPAEILRHPSKVSRQEVVPAVRLYFGFVAGGLIGGYGATLLGFKMPYLGLFSSLLPAAGAGVSMIGFMIGGIIGATLWMAYPLLRDKYFPRDAENLPLRNTSRVVRAWYNETRHDPPFHARFAVGFFAGAPFFAVVGIGALSLPAAALIGGLGIGLLAVAMPTIHEALRGAGLKEQMHAEGESHKNDMFFEAPPWYLRMFLAMIVAITFAPAVSGVWLPIMVIGLPLAAFLTPTIEDLYFRFLGDGQPFNGYNFQKRSMDLPFYVRMMMGVNFGILGFLLLGLLDIPLMTMAICAVVGTVAALVSPMFSALGHKIINAMGLELEVPQPTKDETTLAESVKGMVSKAVQLAKSKAVFEMLHDKDAEMSDVEEDSKDNSVLMQPVSAE